ncbi:MAG TPA: hemolysin family protein [Opitutaceae bacterium]|jgi:putative hemolysin|nr:hemolysin family protein [Opitutaceae bacterium]
MNSVGTQLLIIGLLLLANGLFAMAEIAVISSRKARLKKLADDGNARARAALALAESPTQFLSVVQVGMTLCSIVAGAVGGASFSDRFAAWLMQVEPAMAAYSHIIAFVLVAGGITFVTLLFGELVPKRIALGNPERIALAVAGPMQMLASLARPVVWLLITMTDAVVKALGIAHRKEAPITDEELSILIEQGLHTGAFNKAEKEMVEGVLGLDQLPVTALMTPRPKIVFLNLDDPDETNWRKIVASGHSHFPVFQGSRDQVTGMVAVKALWAHSAIGLQTNLKNLLVPALIVPETMQAMQLLEQFKKTGKHVALVGDEFGGIQGLVTLIDVLEAIVGDMPAMGRRGQPEVRQREDGSWLLDATLSIGALKTMLQLDALPGEDEADFQTLAGFIVTQFGRIPATGDHFDWAGWHFEVMDMDRHRVDKVIVTRVPPPAAIQKATG